MTKHTAGPWKATTSWRDTDCARLAYVAVHNMDGGDEIAACRNARRDRQADAARIVACVNALDGIEDPEAFVEAAKHITRELTDGILAHGLSSDQRELLFSLARAAGGRR